VGNAGSLSEMGQGRTATHEVVRRGTWTMTVRRRSSSGPNRMRSERCADDLAEVHPAEVEEASHLPARVSPASGVEERRRHRLEVERDVVVFSRRKCSRSLSVPSSIARRMAKTSSGNACRLSSAYLRSWFMERISRDEDARDMSPARVRRAARRWNSRMSASRSSLSGKGMGRRSESCRSWGQTRTRDGDVGQRTAFARRRRGRGWAWTRSRESSLFPERLRALRSAVDSGRRPAGSTHAHREIFLDGSRAPEGALEELRIGLE